MHSVYYLEYQSYNHNLQNAPGGMPNLDYENGEPWSANWSLKSIKYPLGMKKTFYYSPAGIKQDEENETANSAGLSKPPFIINNIDRGNLYCGTVKPFHVSFVGDEFLGVSSDVGVGDGYIKPLFLSKTIGGPPVIVRIKSEFIDPSVEDIVESFEYLDAHA